MIFWRITFAFTLAGAVGLVPSPRTPSRDNGSFARVQTASDTRAREAELKRAIESQPGNVANWLELARLQEARDNLKEAERTLKSARVANRSDVSVLQATADFFFRTRQFAKGIPVLEELASREPQDATAYASLSMRVKSMSEGNPARRDEWLAKAGALSTRAIELLPSAPRLPEDEPIDGQLPVRVGPDVKGPTKVRDVRPNYPALAIANRVSGTVVLDAVIDTEGNVRSATVVRSIRMLDAPAVESVKGWKYQPALRNGVPVPVVMTLTVSFTIQ